MGRSTSQGQEQKTRTNGRRESDVRVSEVAGRVARTLAECVEVSPELTEEEILEALMREAAAVTRRLRAGQRTPADS